MKRYATNIISLLLMLLIASACSLSDDPNNPEPVITALEVTGITRTEADISVRIDSRGGGSLTYLRFYYGEGANADKMIESDAQLSGVVTAHLESLKPGTTYSFYAEGGTETAKITTERLSFTTVANERPTVSAARTLASGPVGVCVGFEVTDDGGERLMEVGCDVTNTATNETIRYIYSEGNLSERSYKMYIVGLTPLTTYSIAPFSTNAIGEMKGEPIEFRTENSISLSEAGTLAKIFDTHNIEQESMVVSGKMNGDDFRFLRRALKAPLLIGEEELMSNVSEVNLADVEIEEGGAPYDGSHFTTPDVVSAGMFANCRNLESIVLPISTKEIMRDVFSGCPRLREITIPPNVSKLYPSSDCASLESIVVSEGNAFYSAADGVLFNKDITAIVWFPLGKEGDYSLPSTITAIGENAFMGTKIKALYLPSSVVTISRGAFWGSALKEIQLPQSMKLVSEGLFQDCASLRIVRLGKSVEFIGNYVFDGCALEQLYLEAEIPPVLSEDSFKTIGYDLFENCTLHVPDASLKIYKNHNGWKRFNNIVGF